MQTRLALVLPLLAVTVGCTSMGNPSVRADYYEVRQQGVQAMRGDAAAFDRINTLAARWDHRAGDCLVNRLAVWDRSGQREAGAVAEEVHRLLLARKPVLAQKTQVDVMVNALRDLESEFDGVIAMLADGDAPAANQMLAAEQKYMVRRMHHSLSLMSALDMGGAVEAADAFGRDVIEFQRLLDASLNGDEENGISPPDNSEVEESLSQIEELFTGYIADSADDLLENVVFRYDAWLALDRLATIHGPVVGGGQAGKTVESRDPVAETRGEAAAAAGDESAAADAEAERAADDEIPADDATESGVDGGTDGDEAEESDADAGE